jgi:phosphoribosylformylglycinamidine synthase
MVQINTVLLPGADASVLRIKGQNKGLAITLDGNSLYSYLDPKRGGKIAVAEACRNLACVGARPVGVTNCLNFGNPEKSEIMWQFKEVIEGMAEACRAFSIPVTGGNVSFYNDTEGVSVYPTPVLGIVGIVNDMAKVLTPGFKEERNPVILLGENKEELGASEYIKTIFNLEKGLPPLIDLKEEKRVQKLCLEAISLGLLQSAHDISEGGLATCLAECSFLCNKKIGCRIELQDELRTDALLFGETQSRIIVTTKKENLEKLLGLARKRKVKAAVIGTTEGERLRISHGHQEVINLPLEEAYKAWKETIPKIYKIK